MCNYCHLCPEMNTSIVSVAESTSCPTGPGCSKAG